MDFEISENMAKDIYIIGGESVVIGQNKEIEKPPIPKEVSNIRAMYMLYSVMGVVCCIVAYMLPDDGMEIIKLVLLAIIFLVFILGSIATFKLHKASQSKTLLRNFILYVVSQVGSIIAIFLLMLILIPEVQQIIANNFTIIIGVVTFPFQILLARELSFIMGQRVILWSGYLCLPLYVIPNEYIKLLLAVAVILACIIGVYRFREIRKRTSEDHMPWI